MRARRRAKATRVRRPEILAADVELAPRTRALDVRVSTWPAAPGTSPGTSSTTSGPRISSSSTRSPLPTPPSTRASDRTRGAPVRDRRLACLIVRSSLSDWPLWIDTLAAGTPEPRDMSKASSGDSTRAMVRYDRRTIRYGQSRGEFGDRDVDAWRFGSPRSATDLAIRMVLDDCPAPRTSTSRCRSRRRRSSSAVTPGAAPRG